jgi:hypothetical protein
MNNWQEQIPGCFGALDRIICGHPSEQERTLAMIKCAKSDEVELNEVEEQIRDFLLNENRIPEHIQTQLDNFRKFLWRESNFDTVPNK